MTELSDRPIFDAQGFSHRPVCDALDGSKVYLRQGRWEQVATCRGCGRTMPAPTGPVAEPEPPRGRYWLCCCRCGADMWLHSARPRLPLCPPCLDRRHSPQLHDQETP